MTFLNYYFCNPIQPPPQIICNNQIPDNNLIISLQNFTTTIFDGIVLYSMISLIPTSISDERLWQFNLSGSSVSFNQDGELIIYYDTSLINNDSYKFTFFGPVNGTFQLNETIYPANDNVQFVYDPPTSNPQKYIKIIISNPSELNEYYYFYYNLYVLDYNCQNQCCGVNNSDNIAVTNCNRAELCFGVNSATVTDFSGKNAPIKTVNYFKDYPNPNGSAGQNNGPGGYNDPNCPQGQNVWVQIQNINVGKAADIFGKNSFFVSARDLPGNNFFYCAAYAKSPPGYNGVGYVDIKVNYNSDSTNNMTQSTLYIVIQNINNNEPNSDQYHDIIVSVKCQANVACPDLGPGPRAGCNTKRCRNAQCKIRNVLVKYKETIVISNYVSGSTSNSQYLVNYTILSSYSGPTSSNDSSWTPALPGSGATWKSSNSC